jgi:hypothetical protein
MSGILVIPANAGIAGLLDQSNRQRSRIKSGTTGDVK